MSQFRWEGSRGRAIAATVNAFEITCLPVKPYYQYEVAIQEANPRPDSKRSGGGIPRDKKERIIRRLQAVVAPNNFTPRALYDGGAIMFASHDLGLPGGTGTFAVPMSDRPPIAGSTQRGVFHVRVTRAAANTVQPSHLNDLISGGRPSPHTATATNLLQLLIRQGPNLKYPNNGKAYFTNTQMLSLGGGLELWRGFFQSVRPTLGRMLINMDTAMAAFYMSGPIIDVSLDVFKSKNVRVLEKNEGSPEMRKLESFLKKLRIEVRLGNMVKEKVVQGLVPNAGRYEFQSRDGNPMTIERHFHEVHNLRLRFPNAFGVCVSPKNVDRPVIYPAEICYVMRGQLFKKRIPEELYTKPALDFATLKPSARLDTIRRGVTGRNAVGPATDNGLDGGRLQAPVQEQMSSQAIMESGMQISESPVVIQGRVLETPQILFGRNSTQLPKSGAWNVVRQTLKETQPLTHWAVINCVREIPAQIAEQFAHNIMDCCQRLGMNVTNPYEVVSCHGNAIETILDKTGNAIYSQTKQPPKLFIIIIPQSAADIRRRIKRWGDNVKGVLTQCVRELKIFSRRGYSANDQYCNNVALKINCRLGGENFVARTSLTENLKQRGDRCMIVGADVAHPGPGVLNRPSVASVVSSWDPNMCRYVAMSRVQPPRLEIISDLKGMMIDTLLHFGSRCGTPARIFFYRDGVSEGELEAVERAEIKAIDEAIEEVWTNRGIRDPKPKVTFIVVGKRHHVRFFPEPREADRSGNCPAGFVVDKGLSSAFARDFFLLSHGGLLGTSRPSHYIVLKDDNFNFMVDELQELSFALCHVYAKATRSVSIPAPVYYADLVCARANFYFNDDLRFSEDSSVTSGTFNLEEWQRGYVDINASVRKAMYFL